jgi:hypothetical protein
MLVFQGRLEWNGETASYARFVEFARDKKGALINKAFDMIMLDAFYEEVLSLLHFEWVQGMKTFVDSQKDERLIYFDGHGGIKTVARPLWPVDEWIKQHPDLCRAIINIYESNVLHIG